MRSAPPPSSGDARRPVRSRRGFTLVEVLAALLMMAIVIPVAMEALGVASRLGVLGQRKAAAMRVAERLLSELIVEGQTQQASSSGSLVEGDITYPWTSRVENWPEDALQQLTVTVQFTAQGGLFDVSATTLVPASVAELSAASANAP
jgi:type II secretion system protein I